jgi:hypothetical protein
MLGACRQAGSQQAAQPGHRSCMQHDAMVAKYAECVQLLPALLKSTFDTLHHNTTRGISLASAHTVVISVCNRRDLNYDQRWQLVISIVISAGNS